MWEGGYMCKNGLKRYMGGRMLVNPNDNAGYLYAV